MTQAATQYTCTHHAPDDEAAHDAESSVPAAGLSSDGSACHSGVTKSPDLRYDNPVLCPRTHPGNKNPRSGQGHLTKCPVEGLRPPCPGPLSEDGWETPLGAVGRGGGKGGVIRARRSPPGMPGNLRPRKGRAAARSRSARALARPENHLAWLRLPDRRG